MSARNAVSSIVANNEQGSRQAAVKSEPEKRPAVLSLTSRPIDIVAGTLPHSPPIQSRYSALQRQQQEERADSETAQTEFQ
jgi:hypothetical protein